MTSYSNTDKQSVQPSPPAKKASRAFFVSLLTIALMLLTAGIGAFGYLSANSPLALLAKRDRPIALATAFIPANAEFSASLLVSPEKLVAFQQALPGADPQQVLVETASVEQTFFAASPLDYKRDIRPWIGDEVTIACTSADIDFDASNGQQPGYLLAVEIAQGRSLAAKESLQLFWQRQSLAGNQPQSELWDGVRIIYSASPSVKSSSQTSSQISSQINEQTTASIGAAGALVGNRFVLFANDSRVIRSSLRATETAANLAQSRAYRDAVEKLPQDRLGLAYLKINAPRRKPPVADRFTAISIEPTQTGLVAKALLPNSSQPADAANQPQPISSDVLRFIPAKSAIALTTQNLNQLAASDLPVNLSIDLPDFIRLGTVNETADRSQTDWQWAKGEYAIAKSQSSPDDWILAIRREADGVAQLDAAASAAGYNAIPLDIADQEAIAWTRFKPRPQRRQSGRQSAGTLETEILGLHLQQGDYEIFTSSIAAMDEAIGAASDSAARSLLAKPEFIQAMAEMDENSEGYLYADWPSVAPMLAQLPQFRRVEAALRPITRKVDVIAATKTGETARLFIRLKAEDPTNE